jgi:site-specific DNA-cytosine methylase
MHSFSCIACTLQVLEKRHPGLRVHPDLRTLDLVSQVGRTPLIDVVVISTPCTDVSSRGKGAAQLGEESNLFFVAVSKVLEYSKVTGQLPTIISENVKGRRFRHRDVDKVRMSHHTAPNVLHLRFEV